jgi:hypothetical protein
MNEIKKRGQRIGSQASLLGVTQNEYRKAYMRWKAAIKRGYMVPIGLFVFNEYVRLYKSKPKSYYYQRRQLQVALATPKWVNIEEISNIYALRPEGYQVDHIIPINGKNVCGLHVPWNLQYLEPYKNSRKSNKTKWG